MNPHTYYSIDKTSYYGPEYQEELARTAFEIEFEKLWAAAEVMAAEAGPEYGVCPAWDGLVDTLDKTKTCEGLRDLMSLMRAHGANCSHSLHIAAAPQCAACMCERRDVVSDRLVLGKPAAVCCGEVA